jgi:hypothetical protein
VVLVYLFLNEEPKFPHAWLQVTDTKDQNWPHHQLLRLQRHDGAEGKNVPVLRVLLLWAGPAPGVEERGNCGNWPWSSAPNSICSIPASVSINWCCGFPGADASQNRDNWMSKARLQLLAELKPFQNLYYVNRTETDLATLAGVEAAEAIVAGDRTEFDLQLDPAQVQIRSEPKAFEFKVPSSGPA